VTLFWDYPIKERMTSPTVLYYLKLNSLQYYLFLHCQRDKHRRADN